MHNICCRGTVKVVCVGYTPGVVETPEIGFCQFVTVVVVISTIRTDINMPPANGSIEAKLLACDPAVSVRAAMDARATTIVTGMANAYVTTTVTTTMTAAAARRGCLID